MITSIVHISDLHLRENWHEEQGTVLREFFSDLKDQIKSRDNCFVVFTGDILQEGKDPETYKYFSSTLGEAFKSLSRASRTALRHRHPVQENEEKPPDKR